MLLRKGKINLDFNCPTEHKTAIVKYATNLKILEMGTNNAAQLISVPFV
jgi:hypothetical protein